MSASLQEFCAALLASLESATFIKLSLGNYKGTEPELKNLIARKIIIKREEKLSFTYRYKTRDIVKNESVDSGFERIVASLQKDFGTATLQTSEFDLAFERLPTGKERLRRSDPTQTLPATLNHDRQKNRLIESDGKQYLTELGITGADGKVLKTAQDKYKQINKFVEVIDGLLKEVGPEKMNRIMDMGAGKGYLTFALYDHMTSTLKLKPKMTGVDTRADMAKLCNQISSKSGFSGLKFEEGTIESCDASNVNLLIALHACDTATDDAIAKGIKAESELIVVAPCCHKQIRRELEKNKAENDLAFLTRYGTFMERQAEMVTDGLRALILNYYGYTTKVFEFVSDAHTPKNVLIVARKTGKKADPKILKEIASAKSYFGITEHHLETIMNLKV